MRAKSLFFFSISFFTVSLVCNANDLSKAYCEISGFDEELDEVTPLQSSTLPLRACFELQVDPNSPESKLRKNDHMSKTAIFNKNFLRYIKEDYNKSELTDLLSHDGSNISQFLKIVTDLNLDASTTYVGLRLFHNKIKSCDLVLGNVTSEIIEDFNENIARFFETPIDFYKTEIEIIRKNLEKIILSQLNDQFAKSEALSAFKIAQKISHEISKFIEQGLSHIENKYDEYKNKERLRQVVLRFIETLLGKTLWDDKAAESIWPSFVCISESLQKLAANGIIDHLDDLDDTLWSLTHCFSRYITSFGVTIPTAIYEKIEIDLRNNEISFLEEPEQDEGIKTKKEHIYEALFKSKIKAYAFEKKGIISQMI